MDWSFLWVVVVVLALDGYLYWHFDKIFQAQWDLTNQLIERFKNSKSEQVEDLGFDITGNETMQPSPEEE